MKCVAVILLGLLALAQARPEAPKPKPGAPAIDPSQQLSELIKNAQVTIDKLSVDIKEKLGVDKNNFADVLKNQTTLFVNNVQNYINTVSEDIKSKTPEVEKVWQDLKVRIGKVAEDINASVPNAKESAELLQKQFNEGVQTVIRESNTLADAIKANSGQVKQEVGQITEKVINIAVEATQNLNKSLQAAAAAKA